MAILVAMQTQEAPPARRSGITESQLRQALKAHDGNASAVASALGISRQHVYKLRDKWGIQVRRVVELS